MPSICRIIAINLGNEHYSLRLFIPLSNRSLIDMESEAKSISRQKATRLCIFVIESVSEQWIIMLAKAFCCRRVIEVMLVLRFALQSEV